MNQRSVWHLDNRALENILKAVIGATRYFDSWSQAGLGLIFQDNHLLFNSSGLYYL